jgi:hypothetical protein
VALLATRWEHDSRRLSLSSRWSTQPFVTELDLRLAQLPATAIDYLREAVPSAPNEVGELMYDYEAWLDDVFAWTQ